MGKKILIPNVPWTATHDPLENIPDDRNNFEPNILSEKNNITVFTFLGVPYAEPPVSQRRFKVLLFLLKKVLFYLIKMKSKNQNYNYEN